VVKTLTLSFETRSTLQSIELVRPSGRRGGEKCTGRSFTLSSMADLQEDDSMLPFVALSGFALMSTGETEPVRTAQRR